MASTAFSWDRVGPRADERVLAGRVAGALWLTVLPMLLVSLALPVTSTDQPLPLALLTLPALAWGIACLFVMPWNRVPTPLFFHVPAALALPYIGVLVALTGVEHSPFDLTLLMLIAFCSYFFPPRAAIPYLVSGLVVQAFPLMYSSTASSSALPAELWVTLFVYSAVGGVVMVGKQQLLALRDEARELSLRDSLTGVANRRALGQFLDEHGDGSRRTDSLGLLLIDVDDFKEVNTHHGLPVGDEVLCAVADSLRDLARSEDMVVRLGGDEFAVVGSQLDQPGMEVLAARALERVNDACRRLELEGLALTASAGWAVYPQDVDSIHQLVTVADLSLRAAKAGGKNRSHAPAPELRRIAS